MIDKGALLASVVFCAHIAGNFLVVGPGPVDTRRFEALTLFPPLWLFSIWLVIWVLQAAMLWRTYGSGMWSAHATALFVAVCVGNVGSQWAGARNLHWGIYLLLIGLMFASSLALMFLLRPYADKFGIVRLASQLHLGWAMLAFVVALGVVAVGYLGVISDRLYTVCGVVAIVGVLVTIGLQWRVKGEDFRTVGVPSAILLVVLLSRVFRGTG